VCHKSWPRLDQRDVDSGNERSRVARRANVLLLNLSVLDHAISARLRRCAWRWVRIQVVVSLTE
jgi:hypothetical protein